MSVGLQVWSQTASNNSTIDTNINWPEGMAPSQVDDSARALMASMAKWRDDNNGTIVTGGTTIAFTATTSQVEASLTAGYTIAIQFNATADTSATLAVDSLAAKPLQIVAGTNLQGGEFTAGDICEFTYSTTGTGQWIAKGPPGYIQNNNQVAANTLTYSRLQVPSASVLLGNPSTSTSTNVREITLGTNLSFSGTVLNAGNNTPVITVITSTATATWQSTTQGGNFPLYLRVRMVGGGGGGGAQATNAGSNGNDTSFGSWTALHGSGGGANSGTPGAGGSGGTNSTGTLITRVTGQSGGFGFTSSAGDIFGGGVGGNSVFGGAGCASGNTTGAAAAANTGSGGQGGGGSGTGSGSGGGAGEFAEFIITSPSTAYNVSVGSGGAGGTAGTQAGGAGATGRIEVIAYWQ